MAEISTNLMKAYALENAIKHDGKANQGSVLAGLFAEGLEKSQIKETMPKISEVIKEVNNLSVEKQEKELKELKTKTSKREIRVGLPELPNAEKGSVVMRMAPFPSGPLHIGNARTLILNDEYVKMYDGKLLLVIDDTIGSVDKPIEPEAYKLIEEGVKWLEVNYEKEIVYKSDRIEKYYEYAEEMIKKGYLYICECDSEKRQKLKLEKKECECRNISPEIQFQKWKKMFTAPEGSMCVRLKTSMKDKDPAFRDRVMFRISDRPHARLGTKYRIYPLLDFSWAVDDHALKITHILRGMELTMETRVENFIEDIFGWPHPEVIYNGHFAIEGVKISKSKGSKEVKSGAYIGWNDPRSWSLQSLRDRGISPEAVRQFILDMGFKKTKITVPVEVLYNLNKKILEENPRYFFVENPQKIKIAGAPKIKAKIPLHPDGKLGYKEYETAQEFYIAKSDFDEMTQGNYRLMHLLTFKINHLEKYKPKSFSFVSEEMSVDKKIKYLHWVNADNSEIKIEVRMPNGEIKTGVGESEIKKLKEGDIVQFERFGFVRLYKKGKDKFEFWLAHE